MGTSTNRVAAALLLLVLCSCTRPASCFSFSVDAIKAFFNVGRASPSPPAFPESFEATYTFSLPYVYTVQTSGLSFPVHIWYDAPNKRLRTDVYGGLDSTLTVEDTTYMIYPRINKTHCKIHHDAVGPTLAANLLADAPLPDISSWSYGGTTSIGNSEVHIWQLFDRKWGKTSTYTFYTTPEGLPVRFYMMGFNIMAASHFDEYLVDFTSFKPGPIDPAVFEEPTVCEGKKKPTTAAAAAGALSREEQQLMTAQAMSAGAAVMPWAKVAAVVAAASSSNGAQQQQAEQQQLRRLAALAQNARFVESWNQGSNAGFKLSLNRFADWTAEEYQLLRGKRSSSRSREVKQTSSLGVVAPAPGLSKKHLPKHVSWRGTPADNVVKDQATCGSCWAFSAVGAMQGAWQLATGQALSLSEQQLVDCSWKYGNNGCQGGEMEPAIQYVADAGGAAAEEDYQYMGQNMFCGQNATHRDAAPVAHFKGYATVKKRDEVALMWAVWRHGPVAISIDASQPTFRFYSEGVYKDKKCQTGPDFMDHAVLLVGYGTDKITGEDYWLVKNSWSKYWGEDGYIRMARTPGSGNDCGVTTDPVLAVVHPDHVQAGSAAAELHQQLAAAGGQQQQQKVLVQMEELHLVATY